MLHNTCNAVVYQRIEIFDSGGFKFFLKFFVVDILEDCFESTVIRFADCVFRAEPDGNILVKRVGKAAAREAFDRFVKIVNSLDDSGTFHIHNRFSDFCAVLAGEHKFCLSGARSFYLAVFVDISVCMPSENKRFFPAGNGSLNVFYKNRRAEYRSVEFRADDTVRAGRKLLQIIFFYARRI